MSCADRLSTAEELSGLLLSQLQPNESKKGFDRRLSRKLGWTFNRVRDARLKRARRIEADELKAVRGMAAREKDAPGNEDLIALKDQISALIRRIEKLEGTAR